MRKKKEEERKKREEEERKKREEEERQKEEEERKRREIVEEKRKKREEERKKKEEEENRIKEEEEKKRKEEEERIRQEKERIKQEKEYQRMNENEEEDIQYTFEEINQIETEPIINLEITNTGKIIVLTHNNQSKLEIYDIDTYEKAEEIPSDCEIKSFRVYNDKIYCALDKNYDNILIMPIDNYDDKLYLNGHNCSVVGLTLAWDWLISADIQGTLHVWKDNQIKKSNNRDFKFAINTITEIDKGRARIAILSFKDKKVRFYDLRYGDMISLTTIENILGSGLQNNMLKLNDNILAIAGSYIYIIDLQAFTITNRIWCTYANDCISNSISIKDNCGYFFVCQALTNLMTDDLEKGTIGYYKYKFVSKIIPDDNKLIKIGSKSGCHKYFITSIRVIDDETIVTGGYDGKIKFWRIESI